MGEGTGVFELQDIARRYGPVVALDGVDLHIDSAATTALIGPSGAGKSTVLRMLIGLDWPDRGVVRFDGEPLRRERLLEQRSRIGYVIQEGGLFPHLTAADNVALVARLRGWSAAKIEERSQIGRAHVRTPVTNAHLVSRILLDKKKRKYT